MASIIPSSENTVFYLIESTIKKYRRFAQLELKNICAEITIDQALVLGKFIQDPDSTQRELSELIFKDMASISRMMDLLERNKFIAREINPENRRRFKVTVTKKGKDTYKNLLPQVKINRETALSGISAKELKSMNSVLNRITNNLNNAKDDQ